MMYCLQRTAVCVPANGAQASANVSGKYGYPSNIGNGYVTRDGVSGVNLVLGFEIFGYTDKKTLCLKVQGVSYRAPGTQHNLLNRVTFSLPENRFSTDALCAPQLRFGIWMQWQWEDNFITGKSVLGGLAKPTEGSIFIEKFGLAGQSNQSPEILSAAKVGIVFQFPERDNYVLKLSKTSVGQVHQMIKLPTKYQQSSSIRTRPCKMPSFLGIFDPLIGFSRAIDLIDCAATDVGISVRILTLNCIIVDGASDTGDGRTKKDDGVKVVVRASMYLHCSFPKRNWSSLL
eukprot:Gb_26577 [translate_table: standard]